MPPSTGYELVAAAAPPEQNSFEGHTSEGDFSTASRPDNAAQQSVQLEEFLSPLGAFRHESTDPLLKVNDVGKHVSLPKNTASKPFILHSSMWLWEVVSLSVAALIMVASIIVLAIYDGKPSPVVGSFTLNTAVAIAATMFRICLMVPVTDCICQLAWVWLQRGYKPLQDIVRFDEASRGPLGSLQLLWQFRCR
jgi:hypothetical protein